MRHKINLLIATVLLAVGFAGSAMAQSNYKMRPGDVIAIEVLEDPSLNRSVLVLPDGSISFPLAGTLSAGGRTIDQVQAALTSGLASNFATEPNVFVSIDTLSQRTGSGKAVRPLDVYIVGEVAAPGRAEVKPGTTILQFLAQAGGPTKFAADKRIELRRTNADSGEVRTYLYSFSGKGRGSRIPGSTPLMSGDVIVVPQRGLFE